MGPVLRPLRTDDVPAWAELMAAIEAVDRTGEHVSADELLEEMSAGTVEVGRDIVGAFEAPAVEGGEDAGGPTLVGFVSVQPRGVAEGTLRAWVDGGVRPSHRGQGIGTRLVEAMLARVGEVHRERGPDLGFTVLATGLSSDTAQADLLGSVGLVGERWTFTMRAGLVDLPPRVELPAGYDVRVYDDTRGEALRHAHNVAFLDHPNFTPWSEELWRAQVTGSRAFRPDVSYVVVPTGSEEIVGYLQTLESPAHQEATGRREAYVAKVGTLREHRGRGLAGALLAHAMHGFRDAGCDEVGLAVDSENPTGALGIYRRAGFEVESRWTNYLRTMPPL